MVKQINTTVKTGDKLTNKSGQICTVGVYKKGLISLSTKINQTSGYTQQVSTRKLNQLIKSGELTPII